MVEDLYEALGVDRNADKAAIRKAYRSKSKRAHPDVEGGSQEKFALIKLAHDCLSDEERRARYDKTGEAAGAEPDNKEAAALNQAFGAIAYVVEQIDARGASYDEFDVVNDAVRRLKTMGGLVAERRRQSERNIEKTEKLAAKFSAKPGKVDRITPLLKARLAAMRQEVAKMAAEEAMLKLAGEIVEEHVFAQKKPKPSPAAGNPYVNSSWITWS